MSYSSRMVRHRQSVNGDYVFRSREDAGREVTVHVFLVNVFIDKTMRKSS